MSNSSGSNWDAERDISQTVTQDLITHTHTEWDNTHLSLVQPPLLLPLPILQSAEMQFSYQHIGKKSCWTTRSYKCHHSVWEPFYKFGLFIHSHPTEVSVTQHQRRSNQTENQRWKPLRNQNNHFSMNRTNWLSVTMKWWQKTLKLLRPQRTL